MEYTTAELEERDRMWKRKLEELQAANEALAEINVFSMRAIDQLREAVVLREQVITKLGGAAKQTLAVLYEFRCPKSVNLNKLCARVEQILATVPEIDSGKKEGDRNGR